MMEFNKANLIGCYFQTLGRVWQRRRRYDSERWVGGLLKATVDSVTFHKPCGRHVLPDLRCQTRPAERDSGAFAQPSTALMHGRLMFNEQFLFRHFTAKSENGFVVFLTRDVCVGLFLEVSVCESGQCLQEHAVSQTSVSINVFLF